MKLLSFEIGELPEGESFRSLHSGFKVKFHQITENGIKAMNSFQPFCFAGLNGSGKSNVLEALASIFYHLEFCVAKFKPEEFEKHFKRKQCQPDAFKLKYLICSEITSEYTIEESELVTINKNTGEEPTLTTQSYPFSEEQEVRKRSLVATKGTNERAPAKEFLPDLVVGYSSGENEILSLPFIKNRLVHFDEYKEAAKMDLEYDEPETSLVYIDEEMSQAVLLACLIFEDEITLSPLKEELGIQGIQSFRINLNNQSLELDKDKKGTFSTPILNHLQDKLESLKSCATSWYEQEIKNNDDEISSILTLDFFVDENTKKDFKQHFGTALNLFRLFQLLYELNVNVIDKKTKEEIYKSSGYYTDGKLPEPGADDKVFYFLNYFLLKERDEDTNKPAKLLLRSFSDGEHQFLHTMGITLLLKNRRTLLLLDEPETHFNPKWRSKFVATLNKSINNDNVNNLKKDVLITSHSPFIISDCLPDKVIFFKRNIETNKIEAKTAQELNLKTYGSSINYILQNFFDTNLISEKSREELKTLIETGSLDELRRAIDLYGESNEKQFLFKRIYELTHGSDDSTA